MQVLGDLKPTLLNIHYFHYSLTHVIVINVLHQADKVVNLLTAYKHDTDNILNF